jgi:NADH:ubiquinone oxidoreductase subunit 2 (subunit N)
MYMEDPHEEFSATYSPGIAVALGISAIGVLWLGILPGSVLGGASQALLVF